MGRGAPLRSPPGRVWKIWAIAHDLGGHAMGCARAGLGPYTKGLEPLKGLDRPLLLEQPGPDQGIRIIAEDDADGMPAGLGQHRVAGPDRAMGVSLQQSDGHERAARGEVRLDYNLDRLIDVVDQHLALNVRQMPD
jgi:hypothetical protein